MLNQIRHTKHSILKVCSEQTMQLNSRICPYSSNLRQSCFESISNQKRLELKEEKLYQKL